jgi:acetyltransferase-like isoleucine patch superfamily enzyme
MPEGLTQTVRDDSTVENRMVENPAEPVAPSKAQFSIIAPDAIVRSKGVEHPIHLASGTEIHGGTKVGAYLFLNARSVIYSGVEIGRFCSIGRNSEIGLAAHAMHFLSTHSFQYTDGLFKRDPDYSGERKLKWTPHPKTVIGSDVWIGAQALIRSGVKIGSGAVVAANAIVTKDVEPYSIVAGVPAQHKSFRFTAIQIERLLRTAWWDRPLREIRSLPFDDIEACLAQLEGTSAWT